MATQPMMSASALLVVQTGVTDGGGSAAGGGDGTGGSSASDGGGGYSATHSTSRRRPKPAVSRAWWCRRCRARRPIVAAIPLGHAAAARAHWLGAAVATTISSGIANPAAAAKGTTRAVPMSLYRLQRSTDRSVPLAAGVAYKLSVVLRAKARRGRGGGPLCASATVRSTHRDRSAAATARRPPRRLARRRRRRRRPRCRPSTGSPPSRRRRCTRR